MFQKQKCFVKNGFKKVNFLSKSSKSYVVWTIRFCSNFTSMWYKHFLRNVWRDFRLPMSATVAGKNFNGKFTAKVDLPIGYFMLPLLKSDVSPYIMLVKFKQNHMVWTIQNFELFDKKWLTIFDNRLMPFLEDIFVTGTIAWC